NIHEGDVLDVLGPSGLFTPAPATTPRVLVLVGGGSGITPLASIVKTLLASETCTRVVLIYGNRALEDVVFKDAFDGLASEHMTGGGAAGPARFVVRHVLELPPPDWTGPAGRLDGERLASELDSLGERDAPHVEYFLCGPAPMMAAARAALEARGVSLSRIREERFVSKHAAAGARDGAAQDIIVRMDGEEHSLTVAPGRTVLETALDAGVEMPFSCTVGGCGACRVLLVQGDVVMDEPNCLSPQERADGYVLACSSRPTSPCTFEV
ncbi:MAG: 2Fe-2S iron-sulfur cluster-binding protein, partial [Polyangiaceae bacterium]